MNFTQATVHVVDDDPAVRSSLRDLLESVGMTVETYDSAQKFLTDHDHTQTGCLLLDIRMPNMSGLELQRRLKDEHCTMPVIFITGHGDIPMAVQAMQLGAIDFIEKPFREQVLLERIQLALAAEQRNRHNDDQYQRISALYDHLTPKEREVMALIVKGKSTKMAAAELDLSPKTVHFHVSNILEKMDAENTVELTRLALTSGLYDVMNVDGAAQEQNTSNQAAS